MYSTRENITLLGFISLFGFVLMLSNHLWSANLLFFLAENKQLLLRQVGAVIGIVFLIAYLIFREKYERSFRTIEGRSYSGDAIKVIEAEGVSFRDVELALSGKMRDSGRYVASTGAGQVITIALDKKGRIVRVDCI